MELTPTHFNFSIPRFAGYKTIVVNMIVIVAGIACTLWPHLVAPSADQIGQVFDASLQAAGGVATALGALNALLRLQTTTPALGMMSPEAKVAASRAELQRIISDAGSWPIVNGIEHHISCALRTSGVCNCGAVVPPSVAQALDDDKVRSPKVFSAGRQVASAFLVPFVLIPLTFGAVAVTLGGCETLQNIDAVGAAATTEQKGFALYGDFVIAEEAAVVIMSNKHIPVSVRRAVKLADAKAKPLADRVRNLSADLATARTEYAAAAGTSAKVVSVTTALTRAVADLLPALSGLQAAVSLSN